MSDLDYITVIGRFGLTVADGGDVDEDPDIVWCDEGTVTLQPVNTFTKVSGGSPIGWTGGNAVIEAPLDSSGYITRSSLRRVNVIDMTSEKVNPVVPSGKATHTLRFNGVKADGTAVNFPQVNVRIAPDTLTTVTGSAEATALGLPVGSQVCDLVNLMPVPTAGGTPIVVGPRGFGIASLAVVGDALVATLNDADGTELSTDLPISFTDSDAFVADRINTDGTASNAAVGAVVADLGTDTAGPVVGFQDGRYASKTAANVLGGTQRFNSQVAFGAAPSVRQPFNSVQTVDAAATGATDKVAHALTAKFTGDFSAATGSNPTFGWGLNMFTTTGSTAGDGKGANIQNLIETAIQTPAGTTIPVAQGLVAQAAFFGATAGATVTQMESLRVAAPVRKDGATAGTATNVYGLFVEQVSSAAVGATGSAFSLFVAGGTSRFGGTIDVTDQVRNAGSNDLQLFAGFVSGDGGRLLLAKTANGNHVAATPRFSVGSAFPNWSTAAGACMFVANITTVPGGSPVGGGFLYVDAGALKYKGSSGTVTTLAAA